MLGEFGEGGNGEESGKGIAETTWITLVGEGEEVGIEGGRAEQEGNGRQGNREGGHGRLHSNTFLCVVTIQHRNHTEKGVFCHSLTTSRLCNSPGQGDAENSRRMFGRSSATAREQALTTAETVAARWELTHPRVARLPEEAIEDCLACLVLQQHFGVRTALRLKYGGATPRPY